MTITRHNWEQRKPSGISQFCMAIMSTTLMTVILVSLQVAKDQFEFGCTSHLKLASTANTIAMATSEVGQAVEYLEKHRVTEGSTALLVHMPDYDVGIWYRNLKSLHNQLVLMDDVQSAISQLDEINTIKLMSMRQTLMSNGQVIAPFNVHVYPSNKFAVFASSISIVLTITLWMWFFSIVRRE